MGGAMTRADTLVMAAAAGIVVAAGYSGGLNRWAGAADDLPLVMWGMALPALGVWLGRRARRLATVLLVAAGLGAGFFAPSLIAYRSRNAEEDAIALLLSVAIPVAIGAFAFATRRTQPYPQDVQALRSIADRMKRRSLFGIILFPQLLQPAVLARALDLASEAGTHLEDDVRRSLRLARTVSFLCLLAIALWTVVATGLSVLASL